MFSRRSLVLEKPNGSDPGSHGQEHIEIWSAIEFEEIIGVGEAGQVLVEPSALRAHLMPEAADLTQDKESVLGEELQDHAR